VVKLQDPMALLGAKKVRGLGADHARNGRLALENNVHALAKKNVPPPSPQRNEPQSAFRGNLLHREPDLIEVRVKDYAGRSTRALLFTKNAPQKVVGNVTGSRQGLTHNGSHGVLGPGRSRRKGKTA
jgi:hypothetical protein